MPLTDRIWNFLKRHRYKFYVAGALTGGVVVLYQYTKRKIHEWEKNEMAECVDRLKREQHYESTQKTCKATVLGLLPNLRDRIVVLCDCEYITELLKSKPSNKLELWEDLKCLTFARLLVALYGCSLLVTVLNIQLSIVGGYMFLDAASPETSLNAFPDSSSKTQPSLLVQQKYLTLIGYFMGTGCEMLAKQMQNSCYRCLGNVALIEKFNITELQTQFNEIRKDFDQLLKDYNKDASNSMDLFSFAMLQNEQSVSLDTSSHNDCYRRLMNETRDLFESNECQTVLSMTVDCACSYFLDIIASYFVNGELVQKNGFSNPNDINLPLAKLIPKISILTHSLLGDRADELISRLFLSDAQKTLGANIYEAFSQDQELMSDFRNHNSFMKV